ncbi:MAG: PorV/PorQ family protein, partial [Candidatus Latescibacterota bacterium]
EAYSPVADGPEAIEWNPAGIAFLNHPAVTTNYLKYLTDMHAGAVAFAQPAGKRATWGLSLRFFTVGDIPRTTIENPTGTGLDPFSSTDLSFKAALGYRLASDLAIGVTGAIVTGTIDDASAFGYSSDVGLLWRDALWGLRLAAAARHIGALASAYVEEVDPFPTEGVVGVARSFFGRALLASAEGVYSVDRETDFHLGAELEVVTDFFLRAGYRTEAGDLREGDSGADLAGLTFGLGFRRVRSYRVDYAYASMGDLGGTHRFSFSWIFR